MPKRNTPLNMHSILTIGETLRSDIITEDIKLTHK